MPVKIIELGCLGHSIVGYSCRFRRHTQVGDLYRVSTVGERHVAGKFLPIGIDSDEIYETVVLPTKVHSNDPICPCHDVSQNADPWLLDQIRSSSAMEAHRTHEAMIHKYTLEYRCKNETLR